MVDFAHALAARGLDVVTFNFLYTEQRRRIPDRGAGARGVLPRGDRRGPRAARERAAARCSSAASRWADASRRRSPPPIRRCRSRGLVLLGYPLHPPGRPDQRRDKHLPAIAPPDAVRPGQPRRVRHAGASSRRSLDALQPPPTLHVVDGGDHSFKLPRKDRGAGGGLRRGSARDRRVDRRASRSVSSMTRRAA